MYIVEVIDGTGQKLWAAPPRSRYNVTAAFDEAQVYNDRAEAYSVMQIHVVQGASKGYISVAIVSVRMQAVSCIDSKICES